MNQKILLVIENKHERELIKHSLNSSGYTIIESESSGSALAAVSNHPDISMVILDWSIEENDGITAFNILYENFPSIPIFVIGDDTSNNAVISIINLGAVDYLIKPVNKDHLSFMVDNILNHQKTEMRTKSSRKQVLFPATSSIELISISKQFVEFKLNFSIPSKTVTVFTCYDLSEILELPFKTRFSCKVISCEKLLDSKTNAPHYCVKANFMSLSPLVASKIEQALLKNLFASKEVKQEDFTE